MLDINLQFFGGRGSSGAGGGSGGGGASWVTGEPLLNNKQQKL